MTIYTILTGEAYTVEADSEDEALKIFAEHPEWADHQETRTEVIDEQETDESCNICNRDVCRCDYEYDNWKESQLEND